MIEAIPSEVVEIRREICARCPTPCAAPEPARRCSACPLSPPGWGEYGECKAQSFGLGDAVALELIGQYGGLVRDETIMRRLNLVGHADEARAGEIRDGLRMKIGNDAATNDAETEGF